MTIDPSLIARKIFSLNAFPRWVRYSLVSALILSQLLQVYLLTLLSSLLSLFPVAAINNDPYSTLVKTLENLKAYEWVLLGIGITFPISFVWHLLRRWLYGPTSFERAEEYIHVLKMAVDNASLSPTQKRMFWNAALSKLATDFSVGASLPNPNAITEELERKDNLSGS